jgi:uncharacterized protein YbjQ (UPF0145 family)
MDLIIHLGIFITLLIVGLGVGSLLERRHYRSIHEREAKYKHILVFAERQPPMSLAGQPFHLVSGSVVISSDYFKTFAAAQKSFFGGRLTSYESLLDRGRREAILRMKEQAHKLGARAIFNVRLETAKLTADDPKSIMCAELLAYGTALKAPARPENPPA